MGHRRGQSRGRASALPPGSQLDLFSGTQGAAAPAKTGLEPVPARPEHVALAGRLPKHLRMGGCTWSFPGWAGHVYDGQASEAQLARFGLKAYAAHPLLRSVDVARTFYAPIDAQTFGEMASQVPDDFRFTAKVPRAITHDAMLRDTGDALAAFARAMEPLGEKLGPLLLQMPAEFGRDETRHADLARFLAATPGDVRLALEFRSASWHVPEVVDLLRTHGVALAWTEWRELPRCADVTADFLYLRWLGDRRTIERYDRVQVDRTTSFDTWEADLMRTFGEVREVYGYFNNHWAGHSPSSANEMKRRLGLSVEEPRDHWTQRELF